MARPKRKHTSRLQKEHRVWITNLAQGGDGVARDENGRVLFVPGALPGEEVLVVELKSKKSFARTKLLSVLTPVEERVPAPCPHYTECGGCDLLHADADAQLPLKAQAAWETLMRISGVTELPEHIELLGSDRLSEWRMRATVRARRLDGVMEVGMLERGSHRIVPMTGCMVLVEPLQAAMRAVRESLDGASDVMGAAFFMELATLTGEVVVTIEELDGEFKEAHIISLLKRMQSHASIRGARLRVEGLEPREVGVPTVHAEVVFGRCPESMKHEELPASMFRQAHVDLSGELIDLVLVQFEQIQASRVLELFSGCGNFTFALRGQGVEHVLAVEASTDAVEVGARLALTHDLGAGVSFVATDLYREDWQDVLPKGEDWPVVLLDPPRGGAKDVCEGLATMTGVSHVVYVACDPASLARDLGVLCKGGFVVEHVAMADMFPGTAHVETVVRLSRA